MNNNYCKNYLMHASKVPQMSRDEYIYDLHDHNVQGRIDAANKMASEGRAKMLTGPSAAAVGGAKRVEGRSNRRRMLALDNDTSAGSTKSAIGSAYKSLIGPDGKFDKKKYNAMYYELHKALWAPGGKYYEAAKKVKRALTGGIGEKLADATDSIRNRRRNAQADALASEYEAHKSRLARARGAGDTIEWEPGALSSYVKKGGSAIKIQR